MCVCVCGGVLASLSLLCPQISPPLTTRVCHPQRRRFPPPSPAAAGPFYPNATTNWCDTCPLDCGTADKPTCLFNVITDPTESNNVAKANPDIVKAMASRLAELQKGIFAPDRGQPATDLACKASKDSWGGFVGYFTP